MFLIPTEIPLLKVNPLHDILSSLDYLHGCKDLDFVRKKSEAHSYAKKTRHKVAF